MLCVAYIICLSDDVRYCIFKSVICLRFCRESFRVGGGGGGEVQFRVGVGCGGVCGN